ncbi:hypothetical protein CROQUDRAFT_666397 [Cronartium quercuum f. sp. fusiforme G11]|uniref:Uncharacterized protein n=1 Tax=Cronartium quercuum f. sp. fusiforme G11 TaxID=708437 RepID=A0A9P6T5B7_9BASI|nr:hypothetical protein CROQUDRAFT_666397 [Cronartium quercuum f. sp. fusiforme G11]
MRMKEEDEEKTSVTIKSSNTISYGFEFLVLFVGMYLTKGGERTFHQGCLLIFWRLYPWAV